MAKKGQKFKCNKEVTNMPMSFDHDKIGKPDCCQIPDKQLQEIDIKNNIKYYLYMMLNYNFYPLFLLHHHFLLHLLPLYPIQ